jgi:pimeloyl-ACP methyl ester carboxylesterase
MDTRLLPLKKTALFFFALCLFLHSSGQQKINSSIKWVNCPDCPFPDADPAFLKKINLSFGYLTVPENRKKDKGRSLRLSFAVLKSLKPDAGNPPLVILHGGPGGSIVGKLSWQYDTLRKERDIIFIDQRGSGFSEPDFSPEMNQQILEVFSKDLSPAAEMKARTEIAARVKDSILKKGIDIPAYNSHEIAADINDLCMLAGYKKWDLWGTSYGTRIALTMMKDFPDNIRSVVLEAPLPPNARYFQEITANFRKALDKIFDKCANDPACRASYPNLKKDFYDAIGSLEKEPLVLSMKDRRKFPEGKFVINAQDMLIGLQQALYGKEIYPVLPILIEQIKARNENVLRAFAESMASGVSRLDYGLYYSVICNECIPFNSLKAFEDSSAGFWGGLSFYKDEFSICNIWNPSQPDSSDGAPVTSNIPVLLLSGETDPMSAPSIAALTKQTLPHSFLYTFQNVGHFVSSEPYAVQLIEKFLGDPATAPDSRHVISSQDIPFATAIHVHSGVVRLAPKLQLNKQDLFYKGWIILSIICLLVSGYLLARHLSSRKKEPDALPNGKSYYILGITAVCLSLLFIAGLALGILRTAGINYFLLGFGLPQRYAVILFLSYLVFAIYLIQLLLWLRDRRRGKTGKGYLRYFLLQVPFIVFVLYFGLFY